MENEHFLLEDEYIPDKEKKKQARDEYENNEKVDAPLAWDTTKMHMRSASLN